MREMNDLSYVRPVVSSGVSVYYTSHDKPYVSSETKRPRQMFNDVNRERFSMDLIIGQTH